MPQRSSSSFRNGTSKTRPAAHLQVKKGYFWFFDAAQAMPLEHRFHSTVLAVVSHENRCAAGRRAFHEFDELLAHHTAAAHGAVRRWIMYFAPQMVS